MLASRVGTYCYQGISNITLIIPCKFLKIKAIMH